MTHSIAGAVHSTIRRFAALLIFVTPVALSGATSDASWTRPELLRAARTLTTEAAATVDPADERAESAVVLVVLDGVRWQEVFDGADRVFLRQRHIGAPSPGRPSGANEAWADPRALMPNLHAMIDGEGLAIGAPGRGGEISATGPQFISLPGYIEIFSGKPDAKCAFNGCTPPHGQTIADEVREAGGPEDVALVASWPNIARAASETRGFAMTAGRSLIEDERGLRSDPVTARLLDQGKRSRAWPGDGDYRPDAITARIALRRMVVSQPRFFFVGLGDADEYAHHNDYRGYLEAVHAADAFLGDLSEALRSMGPRGRHTTVLVTADHGRAHNFTDHGARFPESGRVWLVAGGADVAGRGLVSASSRHTLSDLAPTIRALLGIGSEGPLPIPEITGTERTPSP